MEDPTASQMPESVYFNNQWRIEAPPLIEDSLYLIYKTVRLLLQAL
ncbi:hypothetical protein [Virgibacillus proomii]|nr:hypothetical protein [Virgibacillus proomii]MBU5267902.1 hypothetical protein [Virgibacillus proomii]